MNKNSSHILAAAITKAASKQTYYTIRLFVDRGRIADAYRAYGYFRWVDDLIDDETGAQDDKIVFARRQQDLLEACYRGETANDLRPEEWMLVDLIRADTETNSGLQLYLRHMMAVMLFDAERRGRIVSQAELSEYTRNLATAVTEALHYFIGHDDPTPHHQDRYVAVTAAHITHMLRDAHSDAEAGYFNIPGEVLQRRGISPQDVESDAFQEWVCSQVRLARQSFEAGRACTAQVKSLRCRLAGYAYIARFEWLLQVIERDNYCLRAAYPERKSVRTSLWMAWSTLTSLPKHGAARL
ncbi:MAG: squalene/phytoene synthase family protein [Caldilineales bacterium]|nr:squalene/phytoene synthase family protein [Caldilineales bacterium]